jgi:hypothetical protein
MNMQWMGVAGTELSTVAHVVDGHLKSLYVDISSIAGTYLNNITESEVVVKETLTVNVPAIRVDAITFCRITPVSHFVKPLTMEEGNTRWMLEDPSVHVVVEVHIGEVLLQPRRWLKNK